MLRLKRIATVNFSSVNKHTLEGELPVRLCNYVDVYYNDSITSDIDFMNATATKEEIRRFTIKRGDVLITKDSEEWADIAVPAYVDEHFDNVLCGYHLAHIRPHSDCMDGRYLFRAFVARGINDQFRVEATGITRYGLGKYGLENAIFLVPPLVEQHAIAAFLDRETARIDGLIEKKERQIELLREKRTALISHAVTKGLNPSAKMKPSGVEWLGEIPEHWETKRLKFLLVEPLKYGANEVAELDDPDLPRYVRITDVNEEGLLREDTLKSLQEDVARPYLLKEGDLLFARSGATVGKTFLYRESWGRAAYAGYLIRARFSPKQMFAQFAAYFARSSVYWNWLNNSFIQATIQNVSADKYANLMIGVPPLVEQRTIAAFLDRETARIDGLIEKVRESIEKLKEYRSAIIS
ncbi:MAG: restriction endonuclease subunit S, partial [Nitrospinae bacterium]|nr:restriction endonuclease subunit S [Nitrospinota bacterium]